MIRERKAGREKADRKRRTPRPHPYILRKKRCRFCADKNLKISYFDYQLLGRFITERGKIIPSRISGTCAKHQRKLAQAIKRARNIGILPFLAE